jgi:ATP-dependent Clp protease ATP-binding subunit ClpX
MDTRAEKMGIDPEKLRRFLAEQLEAQKPAQPEAVGTEEGDPTVPASEPLRFDLKPEELEAYLDQFVIRQSAAKAILATKICTHFNRLNLPPDDDEDIIGNIKNNVLMIGPTGVGKTYLIKLISRKLGVPFVKGDATKFSETGYVGGDVEDLVRELVRSADGDIERAEVGIIYIDEIDKIASSRSSVGPDVSRSGVQRNLLKLMEETEVDLKAPHDIASQMESVMQMQRTGKLEHKKVNTRNILFIVSGAFGGLEDIIARRLNQSAIGFRVDASSEGPAQDAADLTSQVRAEDLMEYGFESEFVGRLPVTAVLHELSQEDLLQILRSPKSSVTLAKKRDFRAYGIDVTFEDAALELLAASAHQEHTGARGLVSAVERSLLGFEKRLPSTSISSFTVTAPVVQDPSGALAQIVLSADLDQFALEFRSSHQIELSFSPAAMARLAELASREQTRPYQMCTRLFGDYAHGLRLAERDQFQIDESMVDAPQEELNKMIKEVYGTTEQR